MSVSVAGTVTLLFTSAQFSLVRSGSTDPTAPALGAQILDLAVTYTAADPTLAVNTLGFVVLKHELAVTIQMLRGVPPDTGSVTGPGIACGPTCTAAVDHGKSIRLTAHARPGAAFTGWEGACGGQEGAVCKLAIDADLSTAATFGPAHRYRSVRRNCDAGGADEAAARRAPLGGPPSQRQRSTPRRRETAAQGHRAR